MNLRTYEQRLFSVVRALVRVVIEEEVVTFRFRITTVALLA